MLVEKLSEGVLCILTPLGPRYIRPSLSDRMRLLWIFRHFHRLPQQVLSPGEQRFVESLCQSDQFVSGLRRNGLEEAPVIGTLEHRVPVQMDEPETSPASVHVRRHSASPVTNERGTS
jgi:hypothetical protein